MAIKFFSIYLGSLLAGAIALFAWAKSFVPAMAGSMKKAVLWSLLFAVVVAGAAWVVTIFTDNLFEVFWIFAAVFLVSAIIYRSLFHRKYFFADSDNRNRVLFGEFLFSLAVILIIILFFSALEYFFQSPDFLFYPVLISALAFFFPLLVISTFDAAWAIPAAEFNRWMYPNAPVPFPKSKKNEREFLIAFELAKKPSDKVKTNFRARGPESMLLGDLFYHFINDYNSDQGETSIEYASDDNDPHEWWFRRKRKWYQFHRILDPELDLFKNNVKENMIIICERL
jgi:Type VI secretion system, TssN